MQGGKTTLRD